MRCPGSCPTAHKLFFPQPGTEPVSSALEGGFLTTGPPGEPLMVSCCLPLPPPQTHSYPFSAQRETKGQSPHSFAQTLQRLPWLSRWRGDLGQVLAWDPVLPASPAAPPPLPTPCFTAQALCPSDAARRCQAVCPGLCTGCALWNGLPLGLSLPDSLVHRLLLPRGPP